MNRPGWKSNIVGLPSGTVHQKNINSIIDPYFKKYQRAQSVSKLFSWFGTNLKPPKTQEIAPRSTEDLK